MQISKIMPFVQIQPNKVNFKGGIGNNKAQGDRHIDGCDTYCTSNRLLSMDDNGRPKTDPFDKQSVQEEYKRVVREISDLFNSLACETDFKTTRILLAKANALAISAEFWQKRLNKLSEEEGENKLSDIQ